MHKLMSVSWSTLVCIVCIQIGDEHSHLIQPTHRVDVQGGLREKKNWKKNERKKNEFLI